MTTMLGVGIVQHLLGAHHRLAELMHKPTPRVIVWDGNQKHVRSSDHAKADNIKTPAMDSRWGKGVCVAGLRPLAYLFISDVKKVDKTAADEKRPSMTVRLM